MNIVLLRAKIIPTVQALDTTKYLDKERDYMPWKSAINNLDFFYLMFDRTEVYGPMQVRSSLQHLQLLRLALNQIPFVCHIYLTQSTMLY